MDLMVARRIFVRLMTTLRCAMPLEPVGHLQPNWSGIGPVMLPEVWLIIARLSIAKISTSCTFPHLIIGTPRLRLRPCSQGKMSTARSR